MSILVTVPPKTGPEIVVSRAGDETKYAVGENNTVTVETQDEADVLLRSIEGSSIAEEPASSSPDPSHNVPVVDDTTEQGA